jgi:hypothetical protein
MNSKSSQFNNWSSSYCLSSHKLQQYSNFLHPNQSAHGHRLVMDCRTLTKVPGRLRMVGQALKCVGKLSVFIFNGHTRNPKLPHRQNLKDRDQDFLGWTTETLCRHPLVLQLFMYFGLGNSNLNLSNNFRNIKYKEAFLVCCENRVQHAYKYNIWTNCSRCDFKPSRTHVNHQGSKFQNFVFVTYRLWFFCELRY